MKNFHKLLPVFVLLFGITQICTAQVDLRNENPEKNIILIKIVPYPSIFGWTSNLPNEREEEFILSKFSQLLPPHLIVKSYKSEYDPEMVFSELHFGYRVVSKKTSKRGYYIVNGIRQPETTRDYWRTKYRYCLNSTIPDGLFSSWEFSKQKFEREQPDFDPLLESIESNLIWDSIPVFSISPVNRSSLYGSFSLGIIMSQGMPGARWDIDFYRMTSPFGIKIALRQLGSRSFVTDNYNGYFLDESGEIGVTLAIKNRTNRLQFFTAFDIGNSQIENSPSHNEKYLNDFWLAPVVGFQYYRTNIGLNGISLTARIIKPFSSLYFEKLYFEFGLSLTWGAMLKSLKSSAD